MKWMLDLNVLLDVIQQRDPFYFDSAKVVSKIVQGEASGYIASHALTTLYYLVSRHANAVAAADLVDWLLRHFESVPQAAEVFKRARELGFDDFEDAALASAAEAVGCDYVVTRNVVDFGNSPIPAVNPADLLS